MHYENLLFTRNQRQDFTAFVRPSLLTNKDVSAIGAIFNYLTDISRLTAAFPSLYYFPLGEYVLLLRHYNSGRQHAGRPRHLRERRQGCPCPMGSMRAQGQGKLKGEP